MRRLFGFLALSFGLAFAAPAYAQSGASCAAIPANDQRLACYDGLFRADTDAAAVSSFTLQSEQMIPARPSGRAHAEIIVSCEAGNLGVAFRFAGNTMSSLGRDVGMTFQPDLERARSQTLQVDPTNTQVLISNSADVRAFIDGLRGAQNLTVRVTPASSRSLNVRFKVANFAQDVAPVIAGCTQ
ncbi:hypothetical protein [Devosia sp. MC521]|uniref:hypothetical protein n=1 Tax=Devosia sp. MC521 TaxID=2759954 RepID=UPI0015F9F9E4|nr:hypothetical protein [Devosia sp. MC521]MBJ6988225.1 hypothetical protein [Devosia sp. MC521]QMW63259.1 hypothetical protein H4N61_02630 [Devosia sp. MC521]